MYVLPRRMQIMANATPASETEKAEMPHE
jgi:hypothetical protein